MDQFDALIIGQPSLDVNTDYDGRTVREIGGAVVYSGFAAAALGHKVCVLPKANKSEIGMVELFSGAKNITVIPLESPHSTSIVVPLKMEKPGPFAGNRADVEAYINEFYR